MPSASRVLINGLSIGSGGGYTVGRELLLHLSAPPPDALSPLALIEGHPPHEQMRAEPLPANCRLLFAPPQSLNRRTRARYESGDLCDWMRAQKINAVLQLNGMTIPAMPAPVLCHNQDPWPYRPEAWTSFKDPLI